tara:strand:+ start:623 stop:829 length:207 start_codon:yes stop_codon:yes gene_type:complete
MTVTVEYKGLELQLEGHFIQAYHGGYEEESFSEEFETCEVYVEGVDIIDLFDEAQLRYLDSLAVEKFK